MADYLTRLDFVVPDELGYLPLGEAGGQLLFHLVSPFYEQTSIILTTISPSAMPFRFWRRQDDQCAPRRSATAPLRADLYVDFSQSKYRCPSCMPIRGCQFNAD